MTKPIKPSDINRKWLLILMMVVVVACTLLYFWYEQELNYGGDRQLDYFGTMNGNNNWTEQEQNHRNITTSLPITSQMKSIMNFPEWYRNEDWGLKQNISLQNITVDFRGSDLEEGTAWENFFFGTTKGLMLEMGAMDGKSYSVSAFFEEKANWRTILIEGNPGLASYLPINRPNSLIFNCAICDEPRVVHFARAGGGTDGILEFMSDGFLKSFFHKYLGDNGELDIKKMESVEVVTELECFPLTQILLSFKISHINFVLLDVEGGEFNVLKTIDFDKITIDVIAVETDRGVDTPEVTKKFVDAVVELLISKGYILWTRKLGRNSWFVSPKFQPFKNITKTK